MVDRIVTKKKYAVIITTYGEVERVTIRSLWPSSRKILRTVTRQIAHIPEALIYFIADYRSTKHYFKWKRHRYHSSLLAVNRAQKERLASLLAVSDNVIFDTVEVTVFDAYYFVQPYLEETLQKLRYQYDGFVIVPMIPVESAFSCGVACQMVVDAYGDAAFLQVRVLRKLWNDARLHKLYTDYLFEQLSPVLKQRRDLKIGLVLVIHGTLVTDRFGNPPALFTGLPETIAFFDAMKNIIMRDPQNIFHDVRQGCINHSRGGFWTPDTIEKALHDFKSEGYAGVVMFPYGFFADNSETEFDARKKLDKANFPFSQYIHCINDAPLFGDWLADKVLDGLHTLHHLQDLLDKSEIGL